MSAADRLIQTLREIDARITRGRLSPEIAAREQRRGDETLVLEAELTLKTHGARAMILRLLQRQRIAVRAKPRTRQEVVMLEAPAVFLQEVLEPELVNLERAFAEYLENSADEILAQAFGAESKDHQAAKS